MLSTGVRGPSLKDWLGRGRTPPCLSTGSHRCAGNVLAATGARPSSTTHYRPRVSSSSRRARRLVERDAHGVQVCFLRERERDGQRDRESEEKTCHTVLAFSAHHFLSILIANANHLNFAHPLTCLCHGVPTRACSARVGCARGLRASATSVCVRERSRGRGSNYPAAATPGRPIRGT